MTKQEFTERTGYIPTDEEYKEIEDIYIMCIEEKDEFCEIWKKANRKLVAWQKKAKAAADKAWGELYAEYMKWVGIADVRRQDPLLDFHSAKYASLIEAENKCNQLKKHLVFLMK